MDCHLLAEQSGAVMGQLFAKGRTDLKSSPVQHLNALASSELIESCGENLITKYWGRYVAFLIDAAGKHVRVLRDPGASLPCYHIEYGPARLFFSDIADIVNFTSFRFAVNYDFVVANALLPQFQKTVTGLDGVEEVLPAQAISFDEHNKASCRFIWNPYEVAASDLIYDRETACREFRETIVDATQMLASPYKKVVVNVGGLDSSIVLSCLSDRSRKSGTVWCFNRKTASPRGDESLYAGFAAANAGAPICTRLLDSNLVDLNRMTLADPQSAPMLMFDCTSPAGRIYEDAAKVEAEALFYGVGGDNVFFQMPYILSALDYVRSGLGTSSLFRVAHEAALYGRRSLAFTLRAMFNEWRRPEPSFEMILKLVAPSNRWPFINPDLLAAGPEVWRLHPLLVAPPEVPPGKCAHVLASALLTVPYYDHWRPVHAIERVCPLLSQPVVEKALRIPTWHLVRGGVDRGLARKAFASVLPPQVLHRTSKSTSDELYERVYDSNRSFIRDRLLGGELVSRKILVKSKLEALLSGTPPKSVGALTPLEFLSWELWIQAWKDRACRTDS